MSCRHARVRRAPAVGATRVLRALPSLLVLTCSVATLLATQQPPTASAPAQTPTLHLPPLDRVLPPRAEAAYQTSARTLDAAEAMRVVEMMAPLWRLAGNPAYDESLDFIAGRLRTHAVPHRVDSFANTGHGWEPQRGTLRVGAADGEVILSQERERLALCINSFATPAGGRTLPLRDVGAGRVEDFAGQDVKGTLVLGDASVGALWTRAVRERGAAGVISTDIAPYTRPESTPDVLQWGSIPYDEGQQSFAFKATPRVTRRLRDLARQPSARVHADIASTFHRRPNRTLSAEITGTSNPAERVVLVAHLQEPGANDNASGAGTLLAIATAMQRAIADRTLSAPRRTITFLWLDEIRGSEQWLAADPARAAQVVAMMSLDMTGQDTAKTGGTFLIEKMPDPSALFARPSDPHSEWGAGKVDPTWVRGHLLNDLHLAMALRRARDTGWVVRTNPYEGGSDHTVFTRAGVPALLNWHFTDRYYHSNLDTLDKVSVETMRHVGIVVAATTAFLASADDSDRAPLRALVEEAARARRATEERQGASAEILGAWERWYAEARESVGRFAR